MNRVQYKRLVQRASCSVLAAHDLALRSCSCPPPALHQRAAVNRFKLTVLANVLMEGAGLAGEPELMEQEAQKLLEQDEALQLLEQQTAMQL